MTKKNLQLATYSFQLVNIQKIGTLLDIPVGFDVNNEFMFKLGVESKLDFNKKQVVNTVFIDVLESKNKKVIGKLVSSYWFVVADFDKVMVHGKQHTPHIPEELLQVLNSVSISTSRGMLYEQFAGTLLQKAILPVIDPSKPDPQP